MTLTSKGGVLEVRLIARQGQATLGYGGEPGPELPSLRLRADSRQRIGWLAGSGGNLYPAPTLQVFPGEKLIVHFGNALSGLTIRDFFIPQYTAQG